MKFTEAQPGNLEKETELNKVSPKFNVKEYGKY